MKTKSTCPWKDWVMDVTDWPKYCFCPYEASPEGIVFGMNMISKRCPGNLVGIYHADGVDFARTWSRENPNWKKNYSATNP